MTFGEADDFVSTGSLPSPAQVRGLLDAAYQQFAAHNEGAVSRVYPALARVKPELFGICLAGVSGNTYSIGAAEHPFTIMSVSKPFVFALVCQVIGPDAVRKKIGVNATGHAFNSAAGIEHMPGGRTNPMVNAGAIATTSLVPGADTEARWRFINEAITRFAGRKK